MCRTSSGAGTNRVRRSRVASAASARAASASDRTLFTGLVNHVPNAREVTDVPNVEWGGYEPGETVARCLRGVGARRVGLRSDALHGPREPRAERTRGDGCAERRVGRVRTG